MHWRLIKAMIVLPGNVLVLIPAAIMWATEDTQFSAHPAAADPLFFWLAMIPGFIGFALAAWTVTIFIKFGRGTPAPWDPPEKFVVRGPYRHVRNPMIIGVLLLLLAEAMVLQSWPIFGWMIVFFAGNLIYFPLVEEKGLDKRFGQSYRLYKTHVPPWMPRLKPWKPANGAASTGSVNGASDDAPQDL